MRAGLKALVACAALASCARTPSPPVISKPAERACVPDRVASELQIRADATELAGAAYAGRKAGTLDEQRAADWLARAFRALCLTAGGDGATWYQDVPLPDGHSRNVLAWLAPPAPNEPWLIVGAHVDHLGVDASGVVFPGADDNASGVAAMLAVAASLKPPRGNILFVGFGAEEVGLVGSKWLAEHLPGDPAKLVGVINLDMVGRSPFLGAKDYEVMKTAVGISAGPAVGVLDDQHGSPLLESARRACKSVGLQMYAAEDFPLLESQIREMAGRSDDVSFSRRGIRTLFFSTSLQDDYHRTTDTADKLDPAVTLSISRAIVALVPLLMP